jgi:hypothetical protein
MNKKKIHNNVRCNKNIIKIKWAGRTVLPTEVTGKTDPLPIMMDEGIAGLGGQKREMLPGSGMVWFDAPKSATHSVSESSCYSAIMLKELVSDCCSHKPCQGVQDGDAGGCCWAVYIYNGARMGAKGGVK